MKLLLSLLLSGLALGHVHGQELPKGYPWPSLAAYAVGQSFDGWTTYKGVKSGNCVETHTWYPGGAHPSGRDAVVGTAIATGLMFGYTYGVYQLGKVLHQEKLYRRLATGLLWCGTALELGVSVKNFRECR